MPATLPAVVQRSEGGYLWTDGVLRTNDDITTELGLRLHPSTNGTRNASDATPLEATSKWRSYSKTGGSGSGIREV